MTNDRILYRDHGVIRYNPPAATRPHRLVYIAVVGLALWLVLSVWALFTGSDYYADYLFAVVSLFIFIAVALPSVLWLVRSRYRDAGFDRASGTFREWLARDFDTWQARLRGRDAAIEILLPIAAVAFGMTALGIALWIASAI